MWPMCCSILHNILLFIKLAQSICLVLFTFFVPIMTIFCVLEGRERLQRTYTKYHVDSSLTKYIYFMHQESVIFVKKVGFNFYLSEGHFYGKEKWCFLWFIWLSTLQTFFVCVNTVYGILIQLLCWEILSFRWRWTRIQGRVHG